MSTNFYLEADHCTCCGQSNTVHIGKRSMGWSFTWQGFRDEAWPGQRKWLNTALDSADAWTRLLRVGAGTIVDEYGTRYETGDFLAMVTEVNVNARYTVGDPVVGGPFWRPDDPDHIEQPDRSTVEFREFS